MKVIHNLLLCKSWADACNCILWFESQTHIFILLPCLSKADLGSLPFHQLAIPSQNLWAASSPHKFNYISGGIYIENKTITSLLKHWKCCWWQTLSVIKVWLNCLTDDDRIFTNIILKSDSAFLSICSFMSEKWCSFSTLFKLNNIIINNNDLWRGTLSWIWFCLGSWSGETLFSLEAQSVPEWWWSW